MILLKRNVADLAAAYQKICEFELTLMQSWIPGFLRSYERRQASYLEAVRRYEKRSKITQMIFKRPKPPGKPPPGLQNEVIERLWKNWIASISNPHHSPQIEESENTVFTDHDHNLIALEKILDENSFVITNLHMRGEDSLKTAVIGSRGGWLVHYRQDEAKFDFKPLQGSNGNPFYESQPINGSGLEIDIFDRHTVFKIIDELLSYHQYFCGFVPFSALKSAEHLMEQEKSNLLKLAATL